MNCPILNAGKASAQVVPEKYITLTKGDILTLTCKVNEETINVKWKKDGGLTGSGKDFNDKKVKFTVSEQS